MHHMLDCDGARRIGQMERPSPPHPLQHALEPPGIPKVRRTMPNETAEVAEFLSELSHPLKDGIMDVRAAILASDEQITEHIKWNAPSFCYQGDDRVTFRLQPGDRLQLVFHRGAKVRADSDHFTFEDDTGLLDWASPDRATLTLRDMDDVHAKLPAVVDLVGRWTRATA